jgi:hypothetical protein
MCLGFAGELLHLLTFHSNKLGQISFINHILHVHIIQVLSILKKLYSINLTYENNCPQTYMSLTIQQNVEFNLDIYWYDQMTLDNKILN